MTRRQKLLKDQNMAKVQLVELDLMEAVLIMIPKMKVFEFSKIMNEGLRN